MCGTVTVHYASKDSATPSEWKEEFRLGHRKIPIYTRHKQCQECTKGPVERQFRAEPITTYEVDSRVWDGLVNELNSLRELRSRIHELTQATPCI
jgi:hypothetical protein